MDAHSPLDQLRFSIGQPPSISSNSTVVPPSLLSEESRPVYRRENRRDFRKPKPPAQNQSISAAAPLEAPDDVVPDSVTPAPAARKPRADSFVSKSLDADLTAALDQSSTPRARRKTDTQRQEDASRVLDSFSVHDISKNYDQECERDRIADAIAHAKANAGKSSAQIAAEEKVALEETLDAIDKDPGWNMKLPKNRRSFYDTPAASLSVKGYNNVFVVEGEDGPEQKAVPRGDQEPEDYGLIYTLFSSLSPVFIKEHTPHDPLSVMRERVFSGDLKSAQAFSMRESVAGLEATMASTRFVHGGTPLESWNSNLKASVLEVVREQTKKITDTEEHLLQLVYIDSYLFAYILSTIVSGPPPPRYLPLPSSSPLPKQSTSKPSTFFHRPEKHTRKEPAAKATLTSKSTLWSDSQDDPKEAPRRNVYYIVHMYVPSEETIQLGGAEEVGNAGPRPPLAPPQKGAPGPRSE